jgi:hypothetical protein
MTTTSDRCSRTRARRVPRWAIAAAPTLVALGLLTACGSVSRADGATDPASPANGAATSQPAAPSSTSKGQSTAAQSDADLGAFCEQARQWAVAVNGDFESVGNDDLSAHAQTYLPAIASGAQRMDAVAPSDIKAATDEVASTWATVDAVYKSVDYFTHMDDAAWSQRDADALHKAAEAERTDFPDLKKLMLYVTAKCGVTFNPDPNSLPDPGATPAAG